jgi:hypothetical protein
MAHSVPRRQTPGWRISRRPRPPAKPKSPFARIPAKRVPSRITPGRGL